MNKVDIIRNNNSVFGTERLLQQYYLIGPCHGDIVYPLCGRKWNFVCHLNKFYDSNDIFTLPV